MFESLQERSRGVEARRADRDQKGTKAFMRCGVIDV
jgi:hypothetical protein